MFDSISFNNLPDIQVNNSNNNNRTNEAKLINPFQESLRQLNIKMKSLIQLNSNQNKSNNSDNIIQKILDNNLYVSSKFKSNNFKKNETAIVSNKKKKVISNNNIKENNLNLSSLKNSYPKISIQNIIIQDKNYSQNLDEISSRINLPNNMTVNNNYNKMILLGNKRNFDDKLESQKESIYKEIKSLYNKYKSDKNKNKDDNDADDKDISMYNVDTGFFEKNETIVIGNPICIIYFNRKLITSIYLIKEKTTVCNNEEIIEVLNKIKNELNEHILKKKI